MIIGIKTAHGEMRLVGQTFTFNELKAAVREMSENYDEENFATQFCSRFKYKELPYSDDYADFKINLDTYTVFVTSHTFPKELDGAKVLYFTDRGTFNPVYYVSGAVAHNVTYLAVCKYDNDEDFYIFHLDENLEVVADDCFDTLVFRLSFATYTNSTMSDCAYPVPVKLPENYVLPTELLGFVKYDAENNCLRLASRYDKNDVKELKERDILPESEQTWIFDALLLRAE